MLGLWGRVVPFRGLGSKSMDGTPPEDRKTKVGEVERAGMG